MHLSFRKQNESPRFLPLFAISPPLPSPIPPLLPFSPWPSAVATRVHYTRDAPREGGEKGSYLICFPSGPLRSIDIALIHFHSVLALAKGKRDDNLDKRDGGGGG